MKDEGKEEKKRYESNAVEMHAHTKKHSLSLMKVGNQS
jgi:hypothetical protein